MAQKVTAMDIRAATALAGQIDNVSQFCRDRQISRQTFYKYRRRFGQDGLAGLQEQSRRPNSSPGQTPAAIEEILRFEPPVQLTTRLAGERIVLGGRTIEPGQEALLSLAAAIALSTLKFDRDPSDIMLVLPADAWIDPERDGVYRGVLKAAARIAQSA